MNPYVYSKKKQVAAAPTPTTALSLVKSVLTAGINPILAFAVVALAAGSTMAITALASPEVAMDNTPSVSHQVAFNLQPLVLGDSTTAATAAVIDDSSLEAGATINTVKLSAKAGSYDSSVGRWDYTISYSAGSLSGNGSITIGSYVLSSGLTAVSGSVDSGAILKPSTVYHITFWVGDSNGGQQAAGMVQIKTGKGTSSNLDSSLVTPCQIPGQVPGQGQGGHPSSTPPSMSPMGGASSTMPSMFCLKTKDGKIICPRPPVCGQMGPGGNRPGNSSSTPPQSPSSSPGSIIPPPRK